MHKISGHLAVKTGGFARNIIAQAIDQQSAPAWFNRAQFDLIFQTERPIKVQKEVPKSPFVPGSGIEQSQDLVAVSLQLFRPHAADAGEFAQSLRGDAGHVGQSGIVEHHVGRQVVGSGHASAPGLEFGEAGECRTAQIGWRRH